MLYGIILVLKVTLLEHIFRPNDIFLPRLAYKINPFCERNGPFHTPAVCFLTVHGGRF
jgi:hypothetical protein